MAKTTTRFDVAEHLRTEEEMQAYIEAAFEDAGDDAAFIARAVGDVARARGMSYIARDAGLSRESLYKALSGERSPDFATMLKVLRALGLRLHPEPLTT
ncbi:addiction module antidote protein [Robbsia sp. KACC 23696]|uniref:addiction module antidote protein n=1 Tax=Robbsia sp. KACC 23696 TaxID=3149231 RepID=UPI00325C2013